MDWTPGKRRLGEKMRSDAAGKVSGKSPAPELKLLKLKPHATLLLTQTANPGTSAPARSSTGNEDRESPRGHSLVAFQNAYWFFRETR